MHQPTVSILSRIILFFFLFSEICAQTQLEFSEFEPAGLQSDYTPVFHRDPRLPRQGQDPIVDIFINSDGLPTASTPIGVMLDEEKDVIEQMVKRLRYNPAVADGEKVHGFMRYLINNYFYVHEEDQKDITSLPVARFLWSDQMPYYIDFIVGRSSSPLEFEVKLNSDGSIQYIKSTSELGKAVVDQFLGTMIDQFQFTPAYRNEKPVGIRLVFRINTTSMIPAEINGAEIDPAKRPMPRKPLEDIVDYDKVHKVLLRFNDQGAITSFQCLTSMNSTEAIAAVNAFHNWSCKALGLRTAGVVVWVTYKYSKDNDRAILIKEEEEEELVWPRINKGQIKWPNSIRRSGEAGKFVCSFVVDKKGSPVGLEVEFTTHPELNDILLPQISKFKYTPATMGGKTISMRVIQPIEFDFRL